MTDLLLTDEEQPLAPVSPPVRQGGDTEDGNADQMESAATDQESDSESSMDIYRSLAFEVALVGFSEFHRDYGCRSDGSPSFGPSSASSEDEDESNPVICTLPWGGNIAAYRYPTHRCIRLPSFAKLVGIARSIDNINLNGSTVHDIPNDMDFVEIGGLRFDSVKCIAFRKLTKTQDAFPYRSCIARITTMKGGNAAHRQICESGPIVTDNSAVANADTFHTVPQCDVVITSPEHRFVKEAELRTSKVHPIPNMSDTKFLWTLEEKKVIYGGRIKTRQPLISLLCILTGIALWALPGIFEWLGDKTSNWAKIVNACIGTGSVLVGLVLYTSRKLFAHHSILKAVTGEVFIHNHNAAKLFAPGLVRKLERVACHPQLPPYLIAEDDNSAVRVSRDGWLHIGKRIPIADAPKHWYHIIMDKGLALDLLEARIYKMEKQEDGNERILRHTSSVYNTDWTDHVVSTSAKIV